MGKLVEKFEDLKCWQACRKLTKRVFKISEKGRLAKDFELKKQLKSAALSTMNNIAEGFGRFSKKEFAYFLNVSIGSEYEVKSMIYVLQDLNYFQESELKELHKLTNDAIFLTLGMQKSVKRRIDLDK